VLAYSILGATAGLAGIVSPRTQRPTERTDVGSRTGVVAGLALAAAGYPMGRFLLGDRPVGPPPESAWLEAMAVAGVVAPVEELVWGRLVEPSLGVSVTSALFAAKHIAVDGRWRRSIGLGLFWIGLGLLRRRSAKLALLVHVGCNAAGVAVGHLTDRDQF